MLVNQVFRKIKMSFENFPFAWFHYTSSTLIIQFKEKLKANENRGGKHL